ncbi:hypothetical protein [Thalassospira sp. TSL5-1]|uniref:hypothetical protein n=1 Tax=Thalassospira sp. TSL5-1 TaxID=1544451 RepID=UPI00093C8E6B|nr:hypothetical protein [Thalassospira sp. TSL5-1]
MGILLTIPILVAGFWFCHLHPPLRYKMHRAENQYLYLRSAQYGLCLFFASSIFLTILSNLDFVSKALNSWTIGYELLHIAIPARTYLEYNTALFILLCPFALAYLFPRVLPLLTGSTEAYKTSVIQKILKDSPLDSFLFDALINETQIMLSMSDKKVYVGFVLNMGEPNEHNGMDQEILLQPVLSGYRNSNLKVIFTTDYNLAQSNDQSRKLGIVLKQDNIVSATKFDNDLFNDIADTPVKDEISH